MKYPKLNRLLERAQAIPTLEFMQKTNGEARKKGESQPYHFLFLELQAAEQELKEILDICNNGK